MCSHESKLLIRECFGRPFAVARRGTLRYGSAVGCLQTGNRPGNQGGETRNERIR